MILTIDIGNTNIVLGGFEEDKLTFVARIATNSHKTEDEYASKIRSVLALHNVEAARELGIVSYQFTTPDAFRNYLHEQGIL